VAGADVREEGPNLRHAALEVPIGTQEPEELLDEELPGSPRLLGELAKVPVQEPALSKHLQTVERKSDPLCKTRRSFR